jgi:hypothetical protein
MAPLREDARTYRVAFALEQALALDPDPAAHGGTRLLGGGGVR